MKLWTNYCLDTARQSQWVHLGYEYSGKPHTCRLEQEQAATRNVSFVRLWFDKNIAWNRCGQRQQMQQSLAVCNQWCQLVPSDTKQLCPFCMFGTNSLSWNQATDNQLRACGRDGSRDLFGTNPVGWNHATQNQMHSCCSDGSRDLFGTNPVSWNLATRYVCMCSQWLKKNVWLANSNS